MSLPQIGRGAIVRSEGFVGVLWATDADVSYVVPVVIQDAGRHRSDVRHDEPLLPSKGALRAGGVRQIRAALTITGHVSPSCVTAIEVALVREARARQFEDMHRSSDHHETAVRM